MLTRLLRRTERTYYQRLLIDNIKNLKKTWSIINDVINKKKEGFSSSKFVINGINVTDNIIIAKHLNKCFVNVASELVSKIPKSKSDPTKSIKTNSVSIFLQSVCKDDFTKMIMYIKILVMDGIIFSQMS